VFDDEAHLNGGEGPCFMSALVSSRVRGAGVLTPSGDLRHGTAPIVDLDRGLRAGDSGVKSPNVLLAQFSIRQEAGYLGIHRKGYIMAASACTDNADALVQ